MFIASSCNTQFGSFCYYDERGALFVSWTRNGDVYTELTLDCSEKKDAKHDLWVDDVLHISGFRFVDQSGFRQIGDHVWRKCFEGGYVEICEYKMNVQRVVINRASAESGSVCKIVFDAYTQVMIPVGKARLSTTLGEPSRIGKINGLR